MPSPRTLTARRRVWVATTVLAGVAVTALPAQTLSQLRDSVRDSARATRYPLFAAAFLGLTEEAELSGGRFRIKGDEPSMDLSLFTLPTTREFELSEHLPPLRFEGSLGYAAARIDIADVWSGGLVGQETRATATFDAYGGFAGLGPRFDLGRDWSLIALADFGLARVDSEARYSGPGAGVTASLFDGILFNWDATYAIYGVSMLLRHRGWDWGEVKVEPLLRYDVRRMHPLAVDDPVQDETNTVQWLVGRLGFDGPTGYVVGGRQVRWVADVGLKVFDRATADVLGFGEYVEVGSGLVWAAKDELPLLSQVGLSAAVFAGEDVLGWTVGLAVQF